MAVTVKCIHTVKPAKPTPIISRQWLPEADQLHFITHTTTVYFYRPPSVLTKPHDDDDGNSIDNTILSPHLETLIDSLSQVLVYFYPFAGRLHMIKQGGRLELECNAMGAQVFEAYSESTINDFGDFCPTPELRELVPPIDYKNTPFHEIPLLLVQLTKFKCGGLSLGMATSHGLVDGKPALHFISCWAKIARTGEQLVDSDLPFLDRTILRMEHNDKKGPRYHHVEYDPPPLLIGTSNAEEERCKEATGAMLKLTKEQVETIKQKANNIGVTENNNNVDNKEEQVSMYSRFEALAGHIWRCTCKARGHKSDQLTRLQISLDARRRLLHPPLPPPRYFGNLTMKPTQVAKSGELINNSLSYAASMVREGSSKFNDDYIRSSLEYLKKESDWPKIRRGSPTAFYFLVNGSHVVGCNEVDYLGNPNLAVTSWIGLNMYDADFGWGKPIYMGPATLGFDGRVYVLPGDEDGSLRVALKLRADHMEAFKDFFYQEI